MVAAFVTGRSWLLCGLVGRCVLAAFGPQTALRADCVSPPSGLVGWWAGNGNFRDSISLNNGAPEGGVSFAAGQVGLAFNFAGGGKSVVIPDSPSLELTNTFTIEAWVNPATLTDDPNGGGRAVVSKIGGAGGNNGYQFGFYGGYSNIFAAFNSPGQSWPGTIVRVPLPVPLTTNTWAHVAWTYDQAVEVFYVNGAPIATNAVGPHPIATASSNLRISGDDNGNVKFDGQIDEVSIYNRALGPAEIQAIYNAGNAGKCGASTSGATVPYFTDFESGVGAEWDVAAWNTNETLGFTAFNGRFGNNAQSLTLTNLVPGQSYTLGFDFYAIDSWDGNGDGDYLNVAVGGVSVFDETFSNYNGQPPNAPQSYTGQPDEGRANFGFTPSFVDAIYRNLEIPFVASNSVVTLMFRGHGLQNLDDESWGLDNVSVQLTASLTNTFIRSTALPPAGSTNSVAIEAFTVSANRPLLAATATNAANFSLREAGADGVLGTADDVVYTLTPSLPGPGGRSVAFGLANPPLQPGHYRFQTTTGLQDTNSAAVAAFTREFVIANPVLGLIETPGNSSLGSASPLPMTESPAGSHFFTAFAVGTFSSTSDVDYWLFNAEAGDVVTIRLESESQGVYPHLRLRNASDNDVAGVDGDYGGTVQIQAYTIGTPGTYYLRVWSGNNRSRYWVRVDQSRGPQLEAENNDSQANANLVNFTINPGLYQARVVGSLPAADPAGDYFSLGVLNVGNAISVNALFPSGSSLSAAQTTLSAQLDGNPVDLVTSANGTLNYTVASNGVHYLHVTSTNRNLRAQYLLNIAVSDGVPPVITGTSLPNEAATTTAIIDRFTLSFSEYIDPSTISNTANYELRGAGPDGTFGTSDDTLYSVATTGYSAGLTAPYTITDGPLQPGNYRLTVRTNIQDRAGNPMAAPFVRNFTVANLPGYVLENRGNDAAGLGTPLSRSPGTNSDGTIAYLSSAGTGASPQGIAAGYFNRDTNLDLVTANWSSGNVSVLTNSGQGGFAVLTNIPTAAAAVAVVVADFNHDGIADFAVANYNANTVTVVLGRSDGTFQVLTNLGGFSTPFNLAAADVNGDGKVDLVVPNYNAGNVSVLLGNGDGTFQAATNYSTGSNPQTVAVGDLNGDGKPDLAVANYSSSTITVLTNLGNGTFQVATNLPVGSRPNSVAIGDVTGDGIPDLVVLQYGDNTVGVLAGKGDGTFQPRRGYFTGTQNAYQLLLADLNGDGRPDIVVPGYGNNQIAVLLNDGSGGFTNLDTYGVNANPIGVVAGDFNHDGRTDLAFVHYNGNYVSIWTGNPTMPLAQDPAGSGLRTVFARGTRSNSGDVDYYRFAGNAGDQVILAVEVPGNPDQSSLNYQIQRPDGSVLTSFNSDYHGWGQSGIVTLPQTGTYLIRVAANYDYQGEYRLRLTLARPPLQLESENNGSLSQANPVPLTRTSNHLQAAIAGYVGVGDGGGDYYSLGNLLAGTRLNLTPTAPASSGLAPILWIYNASGTLMTNSTAGATNLAFTVPTGQDGTYYVQVTAAPAGFASNPEIALQFSGGSDYVDLGNWFNYQTFTLSMWVNPGASQNSYADIMDNNHRAGINWVIQQDSNNNNHYGWGPGDNGGSVAFTLTPNVWQHLAITRDSTNISSVYVNGQLVGTAAAPGQINYDGNQFLRIGRWGGGGRNWNGLFDELRIWNRALSPAEIVANMTGHLTGTEPNLVGYWPFDEGYGTNSVDLSPSNHVAFLVNGPSWVFTSATNAQPPSLAAQYLLSFDLTNPVPPAITGVTLPPDGFTTSNILSSFTVSFSEDMDPTFAAMARNIYRYNGQSYLLTDAATTWWNAEAQATALGGHLAAITNAAQNMWINETFSGYGDLWIGLNDMLSAGTFVWSSGVPLTYNNWSGGEPNNSGGYESAVRMYGNGNGSWDDYNPYYSLRGVIEVTSTTDSDGDGLVDGLDPFPSDPLNAFDLRAAGPDGQFDTTDDVVYRIYTTGYSSGLSASFAIADGPLQPGSYRFKVTPSLKDRFGNPLAAPYIRYFTIAPVGGLVEENRRSPGGVSSTTLSLNPSNRLDGSFTSAASIPVGRNPQFVARGYVNGDTNLDLVAANFSDGTVTVLLGDGTGAFQAATNVTTGSGAISVVLADFNGDHKLDLAVANYYANTVSILLGDGNGGFQVLTNYSGFSNPANLAAADFNKDTRTDLVVPNYGGNTITVLLGNGDGTFRVSTNYTVGSRPETVAVGDLNGDGQLDLAVANYNSSTVSVLLGNGDGTFQPPADNATAGNPRYVTLGDVNGDGRLDMVTVSGNTLSVFLGNGDGTFQTRADDNIGSNDPYQVVLADLNGDGRLDAAVASYGSSRFMTVLNNGDGTFGPPITYNLGPNPISVAAGDYNSDGRLDLAVANYNGDISILLGNHTEALSLDPAGTGLMIGAGRGNLADGSDLDYWTFSAQTGDRLFIAAENPGNPANSSLLYRIYSPDGSQWTYFYSDNYGRGQISLLVPASGTYTIRVESNNQYYGEYRLRVTLAKAPVQLEVEDNGSLGNANTLTFALSAGRQTATVLGFLSTADGNGDFYQLGNLADGTQISLGFSRPASSALAPLLEIYNSAGNLVTNGLAGQTNLSYTIGTGNGGAYYAHILGAYPARNPAVSNALYFNGGNDYINTGNWAPGAQWSVQAWVMPVSLPGGRRTVAGSMANCQDWGVALQDGRFGTVIRPPGGCSTTLQAPTAATPGMWYHVASVSDGTNAYLYVNGILQATGPVDPSYSPTASGTWIGGEVCCGDYFPGFIQEVSIWGRALAPSEITAFMTNSPTGSESGLLGYWRLQDGSGTTVSDLSTNAHDGTLVNGPPWTTLGPAGSMVAGLFQQYLLSIALQNTVPPQIVSVSLPPEGSTSSNILDRFSLVFSEDLAAATVTNAANYELRNAGPDNLFGTADDQLYTVANSPTYTSGTSAAYGITDGPLQPGRYRFIVKTNLTDRTGTFLATPYVRNFAVTNLAGFFFESRFDNSAALATTLSPGRLNRADGSFSGGPGLSLGSSTERLAAGLINGDTNLDLVATLWQSGGVAVLLGNGDGTFQVKTNYATGSQAWSVALGKFNTDAFLDLAVVNYGAGTVTVLTGHGDGTFQLSSNYTVGSRPYHIVAADFNQDGKLDLAVPNSGSDNVSILLGNGDGTFQAPVSVAVGHTPLYLAVGDVNGDGKPDLVVANNGGNNVSVLFGNGNGTFAAPVGVAAGSQPRAVALADLNNDGKLDLAVFNGGDNTISVMLGNGDGSFRPRTNYAASSSDGYELLATDLNGDGWRDLVVDGYNNNTVNVLLNQGDGTFQPASAYAAGSRPVGLVAGDFNNDGRPDLIVGNDTSGGGISVLLGNDTEPLAADAATGLRISAGRGNLFNSSEVDYWSFDALAGDRLFIAADVPGNPANSSLLYRIYEPDGGQLGYFYSDYYGRGQVSLVAPTTGAYLVRAEPNNQYYGEYRLRVTLARPPVQMETENNDNTGNADSLDFTLQNGHQQATVLGFINSADGGDFYRLGNLASNSVITLNLRQPASSGFADVLEVYNSAGSRVAGSAMAATNFSYTVPFGADGAYYADVRNVNGILPAAPIHPTGSPTTLFYSGGNSYSEALIDIPETALALSFWFRTSDPNAAFFSVSNGGGDHDRHVYLNGGNIFTRIYSAGTVGSSGLALADGAWHYVVFTYGGAIGGNQTYVDGVQVASGTKASSDFTWQDRIRFGFSQDAPHQYLAGYLDEVRLWNRAFTPADVQTNMTNSLTGTEPGLIGYWRFNDGTGTNALDRSTNAHNAYLLNGPLWLPASTGYTSPGLFAQYLLDLDVHDTSPPAITSVTLPAAGSTNLSILDHFTVGFTKDVDPAINALNRSILVFNSHAYTPTDSSTTWYNAETQARSLGGHLATVNGAPENAWLLANFGGLGSFWIGLSDEAQKGNFLWASGEPLGYTNWSGGTPDNSNNKDYTAMISDGTWANYPITTTYRGVIEVTGPDTDGDGIPDTLDPYPNDPYNVFDLRAAGPDGQFDTADDQVYHLAHANYTGGLSLDFSITDGPLQPGSYRFTVTSALRDLFGNPMAAPFVQYFSVGNLPGYVIESRTNNTAAAATPLPLTEDPPGMKTAAGRGTLSNYSDMDYWSFTGTAGDLLNLATFVPGSPAASQLHYQVYKPDGSRLLDFYPSYYGDGQTADYTLPTNGTYLVAVSVNQGYYGEYQFRITTATPPMQLESEDNGSLANANSLTFTVITNTRSASVVGNVRTSADLDYFNLGTVTNGNTIFLSTRLPGSSTLVPIVSVYNSAGVYQNVAAGGQPNAGVANVPITTTDTYYALVRAGSGTGGLMDQYVLDVNILPTGSLNFPNLVVAPINLPSGSGILSGQPITYSFTVQNLGSVGTGVANWIDRAVLSPDQILGNADDLALGFFPHTGALSPGAGYSVTNTFTLPDGLSGDFYLIVQTDAGNAVNEYLFAANKTSVSTNTFHVNLAPYPDLTVENFNVVGPDPNSAFTITWNTANRGNAAVPTAFFEKFVVRNQVTGDLLVSTEQPVTNLLAPNAVLARVRTVTVTNAGVYQVQVVTDSRNSFYEYNTNGPAAAIANNTAVTNFQIIANFTVTVQSSPTGAGVLTGGGGYSAGAAVTVTATPNTNTLPYLFVNWTEGGAFQSASASYTFLISRDRSLTANFTLPSFLLSASNNPPAAGSVSGLGSYFYGTTNLLTAVPNFGYRFTNWTENGTLLSAANPLAVVVTNNRFLAANYVEANLLHVVTTGTSPTNVTAVTGAGTYTNGQTTVISAPLAVTNPPNRYAFREFRQNGAPVGAGATFTKTFSTLDPTNVQFIAYYDASSILPVIVQATPGFTNLLLGGFNLVTNPVPASTNYQITLTFDRGMDTNFTPLILITNSAAAVQPVVPTGGVWFATTLANDSYLTPFITLSTGMDGAALVQVSGARDPAGLQMAPTNVAALVIDVTPPPNPALSLVASNNSSATVSWSGYTAPPDLNGFRLYLATNAFTSVAGLAPVSSVGSSTRGFTYTGLALDQPYYAAAVAVDNAGNRSPAVTPLAFTLASTVPPPVPVQVTAAGPASALVSWTNYDTSSLLGFAGFRLYSETTNFNSVLGHTTRQTLGTAARSVQVDNLDRSKTYYFAVVGVNGNNAFNPAVTTATWSDPFSGNLGVSLTVGGPGQPVVDILHSITLVSNAVLTVPPGTTVRFAPGTGLTVQQGQLNANGTPLDPIVFTSANDQPGLAPAAGDWNGLTLGSGAGASVLRNVFVDYGAGLTLSNCAPTVDAFTALNNAPAGLTARDGALLNTTNALLAFNIIGAQQLGAAQLALLNSSIKNNGTNALAAGGSTLRANQDWWGTAVATDIDARLQGTVDRTGFLTGEPLLTPALGTSNNVTQVGRQTVGLRLACRTADSMRLSEDSTFNGVFFTPFTNATLFPLSAGGGQKTVFAQYRSVTGQTSPPVSVAVTYITAGPTITAFNLSEGQVLNRPLAVTGSATAPLGMAAMEFYVDGVGQGTNAGGTLSLWFDVRNLSSAIHRVQLVARDNAGNFATADHNVLVAPTPPPAPQITTPAADLVVGTNRIAVGGTAEPFVSVRLQTDVSVIGTTNADATGNFTFPNVPLVEGANNLTASALDALGSARSAARSVVLETEPPAQLIMDPLSYSPGQGLYLSWHFPDTGKRATSFQVFWSTNAFTNIVQATGRSQVLPGMSLYLQPPAPGVYFFAVAGLDDVGNISPLSAPITYTYDPYPPAFTIAFDKTPPVGVGSVQVTLTASKALANLPSLILTGQDGVPFNLPLTNLALNAYVGSLNITPFSPSGPVRFSVAAQDVAGNVFNGAPTGPTLVIDVDPPFGTITTLPNGLIQVTNTTNVAVSLALNKPAAPGSAPQLSFNPPTGSAVPLTVSGAATNWNATLTLQPSMGSGYGTFSLTVTDALANAGHLITSGRTLEIYNTALPSAPGQPVHFEAVSLAGGRVQLSWSNVPSAEIYRVYSQPGTNFTVPTVLVADNLATNGYIDLPAADGYYRYVVTASRRGAEGTNSIVRVALSDRTPPPAPTNVAVQLVATGVRITWQTGAGETPDHYNLYRNGALIGTVRAPTPVIDAPPRGVLDYTVGANDALGNEALSAPASLQLLVGAVNNLQALVNVGQAPYLSWTSGDSTAVGYNVYRNGVKQNPAPLTQAEFVDTFGVVPGGLVIYSITSVNATNAESAARTVQVYDVSLGLTANTSGGAANPLVNRWFDNFALSVSNSTSSSSLPLASIELRRTTADAPALTLSNQVNAVVIAGSPFATNQVFPATATLAAQSLRLRAVQQTDLGGSSVIYQNVFGFPDVSPPGTMITVSADQPPLSGGLARLNVQVFNHGYAPTDLVVTRNNGSDPGDLYISLINALGQEVSRVPYNGMPAGTIFRPDGTGILRIDPGGSSSLVVSNILVPVSLGTNSVFFQAAFDTIYYAFGSASQLASGPLSGGMVSSLALTPYYGTAQTDRQLYANDDPVIITGQALDRLTGQPVTNAVLKIGFFTQGYRFYQSVTTDSTGSYRYTYNPPPGLSGTLSVWAAHPDVFDVLNQAQITIYRMYASPGHGDIRMTKNDSLPFSINLINPGDATLTGFTLEFHATQMQGTNTITITNLTGALNLPPGFTLGPRENQSINLALNAALDAPDNASVQFILRSAEGAKATFVASVSLLPALPILTVTDPAVGYVQVSVNRGDLKSSSVSIVNRGLRDLKGVTLTPPTNTTWMTVSLPVGADGLIHLPDLPVGATNSFVVAFTPPADASLDYHQDFLTIQGTNAPSPFTVNLYALVTSSSKGAVQFYVDDILTYAVPGADVRIKNTILGQEFVTNTDANGYVTVTNLQEGDWAWQVGAPGHSANVGVVSVIAGQTVQVDTRLSRSLVTVNFVVEPVPFTDRYEITIEQTFETHVPAPVLVVTPPLTKFENVGPGFETTFIAVAKNEGLIEMHDLTITGQELSFGTLTPLITYIPVLLPQQSIEIPFRATYTGSQTNTTGGGPKRHRPKFDTPGFADCATGGLAGLADFLQGINAICNANADCADLKAALKVAAGVAVLYSLTCSPSFSPIGFLPSPCPSIPYPVSFVINLISCIAQQNLSAGPSGGPGGGGPGPIGTFTGYGGGPPACFVEETRVWMADGSSKPIALVQVGDWVRTEANSATRARVREVTERIAEDLVEIQFIPAGSRQPPRTIIATTDHAFWVDGQGWTLAQRLQLNQWLTTSSGQRAVIVSLKRLHGPRRVYSLVLREDHAFFANDLLVRDRCGLPVPGLSALRMNTDRRN